MAADWKTRVRHSVFALCGVTAFLGLALLIGWAQVNHRAESGSQDPPYATPFALTNQNGKTVTEKDFLGKPSLWFFGFTHCPEICPTTLSDVSQILDRLGKDANKLNVVFVSVDPTRDTASVMKEYIAYFSPRIIGLTGPVDDIGRMAKARYIYFEKASGDKDAYDMQHTAGVQMVTAEGAFSGTLDKHESLQVRVDKVKLLISKE